MSFTTIQNSAGDPSLTGRASPEALRRGASRPSSLKQLQTPGLSWLRDKHLLISGGSSGIGKAIAQRLVGVVRKLTLVSRNKNGELTQTVDQLKRTPKLEGDFCDTAVEAVTLDVRDTAALSALIRKIYEVNQDQVDAFINGAGGSHIFSELEFMSHEDIERIFDVNAKAPIFWLRELLPRMKNNKLKTGDLKRGHIVMLSSRSGERALSNLTVYAAAKGAVEKLVEGVRTEYVRHRIGFTLVNPGSINTPFTKDWTPGPRDAHNAESMSVEAAIEPIVLALDSQFVVNKVSYESIEQWQGEPGVLKLSAS